MRPKSYNTIQIAHALSPIQIAVCVDGDHVGTQITKNIAGEIELYPSGHWLTTHTLEHTYGQCTWWLQKDKIQYERSITMKTTVLPTNSVQDERKEIILKSPNLVNNLVNVVREFNEQYGIENPSTLWNITYLASALAGEAGEVSNAIKKILRDGVTEERKLNAALEIVDNFIYGAMLIDAMGFDFDELYAMKEAELHERMVKTNHGHQDYPILRNLVREWK